MRGIITREAGMAGLRQLTKREQAIVGRYAAKHGLVMAPEQPIADSAGGIGAPLVRIGTLARLEQHGKITPEMAEAGARFHAYFQRGGLDGLKAADMGRVPIVGGPVFGDTSPSHERCRVRIAEAVAALGGNGSVASSVVWHCCGLEWSVRRWALTTRRPDKMACGILIGALDVLAGHFADRRPGAPPRRAA